MYVCMYVCYGKATPSDNLVSGPEVFLIACGRAAFLIMSLSISLYELIILQMNIIILYRMDHYAHA